ncbi:hypothetical protein [Phormidium sp. CCY1219]|nr:hypothetical protein [Phormidium sp. CCY1219]
MFRETRGWRWCPFADLLQDFRCGKHRRVWGAGREAIATPEII